MYIHDMALEHDKVFQMRTSEEFLRRIDDWRRHQPDLPSRAEAIRRLIQLGLEATPHMPAKKPTSSRNRETAAA